MPRINREEKEQKRLMIIAVAANLIESNSYHDISLDMIAQDAQMTKSNLYHYFSSKEELYQEVFFHHLDKKLIEIDASLTELSGSDNIPKVVAALTSVTTSSSGMNEVSYLLGSVLTRNISDQDAKRFQEKLNNAVLHLTKLLLKALPSLDIFRVEKFIDYFLSLKNGLWAEYSASEKYKSIIKDIPIHSDELPFETKLAECTELILQGLYAQGK